ncbi:MAG TPA: integrase arm-type DNA-binding domain-containing protein, partial [Xanthomonadaceae bacterium]|nr:integrase arm-type DNA-binding domain-containing protein [Xanthomonadaceae bacterium]
MALSATAIRNAKPGDKPRKLPDGGGLYLLLNPNGARWWRLKYRHGGKEKLLSLGTYPDTSLADARAKRDEARKLLAAGVDPSEHRKAERIAGADRAANSLEVVAREWYAKQSPQWAPGHAGKIISRLERDLFPWIGARPIADVNAPELLRTLRRIEERGALETAHRALQNCGQIFRYAIATGRATHDPSADLRGALAPWKSLHYASITDPIKVGELL